MQTYGIGIKEVWRVKPENHRQGHIMHTAGWPLDSSTYGGSFMYHFDDDLVRFIAVPRVWVLRIAY